MTAFAECYTTAAADIQTLDVEDTFEALSATFTAGLYGNTVAPTAAGVIEVHQSHYGRFDVSYSVILTVHAPDKIVEGLIFAIEDIEATVTVNGSESTELTRPSTSVTVTGKMNYEARAYLSLAAGDEVQIALRSTSAASVGVKVHRAHLRIERIG